jgi:HPt (histidine-containing phosphotransfer) domain-containing protein
MLEATFAPAQTTLDIAPLRELEPMHEPEPLREPGAFDALVREIGEDGAGEVRAVFWSDTSARLKLFRTLDLGQHRGRIGREAHSLKSAARTFGYLRLATLAQQLETTADALGDAEFCDLLERMDAAYAAARKQEPQD